MSGFGCLSYFGLPAIIARLKAGAPSMLEICVANATVYLAGTIGACAASPTPQLSVIEAHVIPIIGSFTCAFLMLSPMKAVSKARRSGNLGDLNPLPWVFMASQGFVYVIYALMMSPTSWYLVESSGFSFLCGGYYTVSAFRLASSKQFRNLESTTYTIIIALAAVLCVASTFIDPRTRLALVGVVGSALAVCMYGSPASTIVQVIRQKSAASIHLPFVLTSALNSLLWATYGLIVNEPFLWAPIGLGLVFNVILLVLKAVFHKRDKGGTVRVPAGDVADDSSSSSCVPRLHVPLLRRLTKNASVVPYAASSAWERAPNSGSPCVPQPLVPQLRMEAVVEPGQMASFKHPPVQEPLLISRNDCPICLEPMGGASDGTSDGRQCIELSCAHMLCSPCATKCSKQGHASCPVCRHPHLLDPAELHSRNTAWRYARSTYAHTKTPVQSRALCFVLYLFL